MADLTETMAEALRELYVKGGERPNAIVAPTDIHHNTLDALHRHGYIDYAPHDLVYVTVEGAAKARELRRVT